MATKVQGVAGLGDFDLCVNPDPTTMRLYGCCCFQ
jgi:hypothetical protein